MGWRLALASPDAVTAVITQNGNGYASNLPLYPKPHAWLRNSGVPVLAVWGGNDEIFRHEGAVASAQDAPGAEISHLDIAAGHIRGFLNRPLP